MITSTRICPHVFSNAFHHLTITPFISAILQKPSLASLEASSSSTGSVVPSSACFDCWVFTEQLGVRLQGALDCTDSISFWKYVPCVYLCSCTSCIQSFFRPCSIYVIRILILEENLHLPADGKSMKTTLEVQ